MIDKLLNLKNKNKALFYILLPIIGVVLVIKLLMDFNIIGAKKSLKKTEKDVLNIEKEKAEAEYQAAEFIKKAQDEDVPIAVHKERAEKFEEKAKELENKEDDVDYDWHLKN